MPMVTIEWLSGRSSEQKAELVQAVTEAVSRIGKVEAEGVWVRFDDVDPGNWATGGRLQG